MPEERMEEDIHESEPVQLQPFSHQVSGHTCVLRFNETTLCKPLIEREHYFYESVPPELQEFVPDYRGIIEVQLQEDSDGYITLIGYPVSPNSKGQRPRSQQSLPRLTQRISPASSDSNTDRTASPELVNKRRHQSGSSVSYSVRLLRSGSIEVSTQTEQIYHMPDHKASQRTAGLNPWSLRCHKKQLAKMRMDNQQSSLCKFILLENVAAQFHYPCILDLKMGTRQHGDDAPEAKKESMKRKCESSTSSVIGVRLCGMQVYQTNSGQYVCQNKYFGRSLTVDGFKKTLELFLKNGKELNNNLLDPILHRLHRLCKVVQSQDTFRFYSSSLLIMYEGEGRTDASPVGPNADQGMDQSDLHADHASQTCPDVQTDVRMIDFAHSTHRGFPDDPQVHQGADHGYLFGLENLIKMLESIKLEHDETMARAQS